MKKLILLICLAFSFQSYAKIIFENDPLIDGQKHSKEEIKTWCEVRGVYSKFTNENGVVNHVCLFVSQTSICYYVKCGEWHNVGTIQTDVPAGIVIEEGVDFVAVPTVSGIQITLLNGYNYNVSNNALTITSN